MSTVESSGDYFDKTCVPVHVAGDSDQGYTESNW